MVKGRREKGKIGKKEKVKIGKGTRKGEKGS